MVKSKNILVYGFGKEGRAAASYFSPHNSVTVLDDKQQSQLDQSKISSFKSRGISFSFGGILPKGMKFDYVIRSPGIRPDNINLITLRNSGAKISSSTAIFFEECPCKIIGVTGTKGKGTTSTLIYQILKSANMDAYLAGNIGTPMLEVLPNLSRESIVVLELSSFQIIDLKKSPHIAVVLMVTSEHLDWHKTTREYVSAKSSIVSHQSSKDIAVVNWDFESSKKIAKFSKAEIITFSTKKKDTDIHIEDGNLVSKLSGKKDTVLSLDIIGLPGAHNLENVCAAVSVAKVLNISNKIIQKVVKSFRGLPHRLELVGEKDGVLYYDDSFSTTPETTVAAIKAFSSPKILILGGSSKNSDFGKLAGVIAKDESIKGIILIGLEAAKIKAQLHKYQSKTPLFEGAKDMSGAVKQAKEIARPKDIVILSPACASFDMFENYHDRGLQFQQSVRALNKKNNG